MTNVSTEDVRDVINITQAEIPDDKIQKMIKRAEVTLQLELDKQIDHNDCTDAEKEAITILAAIHAICYLTGGSATGLNFTLGDQNITLADKAPPLEVLQTELERILNSLRQPIVRKA